MAEPIYPRGFERLAKVYSGQVEGKPRGRLPNAKPLSAFFYQHTILRQLSVPPEIFSTQASAGFWTIQLKASKSPAAKILFEQSVLFGMQGISGFGGLITEWYTHELYTYKFKTRICDGQPVPPVYESSASGGEPPTEQPEAAPRPARPAAPQIFNVKVTSLSVKMPALPERATALNLEAATLRVGPYTSVATGKQAGDVVNVDVTAQLGVTSGNPNIAPTEKVWWRIVAVGPGGSTAGREYRDIWTHQTGTTLDGGYQGYLFGYPQPGTAYYEQSLTLNQTASGGNFGITVGGDWISPVYKCKIPVGAYLDIISDYWVGQISNNDIYYSISYLPGLPLSRAIRDVRLGASWVFFPDADRVLCERTRRREKFDLRDVGPLVASGQPRFLCPIKIDANFACFLDLGNTLQITSSPDEGETWDLDMSIDNNIRFYASVGAPDGGAIYALGIAEASEIDNTKPENELIHEGDTIWMVIQRSGGQVRRVVSGRGRVQGQPPPEEGFLTLSFDGVTFTALVQNEDDVEMFESTDEMRTWKSLGGVPS